MTGIVGEIQQEVHVVPWKRNSSYFHCLDYSVLQAFQTQVSIIQRDAIWFFHTKVMQMYACSEKDFVFGYVISY